MQQDLFKNTKRPTPPTSGVPVQRLVSWCDKNGTRIEPGDNVLVENNNRNISETGVVTHDGKILFTSGREKGKYGSVAHYLDAIWWRNDTPANWLLVLS